MRMKWFALGLGVTLLAAAFIFAVQIVAANRQAANNFGDVTCWLVPEPKPRNLPEFAQGPKGYYIPNPFQQVNRAIIGIGIDDPAVHAPHFGLVYRDGDGQIKLAAWSYRKMAFWTEPQEKLQMFVTKLDLEACLAQPG
jgi:hypothetical protein